MSSLFQEVKSLQDWLRCKAAQAADSYEVLARGPAKPNWPGRDGQRGTDTAGAGGLLLHLGLLGLFCCFAPRPIIELWRRVAALHPLLTS